MSHRPVRLRARVAVALSAAALVSTLGAPVALGGELTGNGKELTPLRANSECAFSGLDEEGTFDEIFFGRTQSWGQLPKEVKEALMAEGGSPGIACNGHLAGMKH